MTPLNQLAPHTGTPSRTRAARAAHASTREARTRRSFDGVLASYIRELSAAGDPAPEFDPTPVDLDGSRSSEG
jgi:hypothetical protein